MSDVERVERLLRSALVPVDPPEALSDRLERGLSELTDVAAAELADWEMSAMRDPRNWARPAAAIVVGSMAAGGLVLVRARQQQKKRHASGLLVAGSYRGARAYALGLGVVYLLVTLLGFIAGDGEEILDLIPVNTEDNFLHLLIGIAGIGAGLATPARERYPATAS